jgi:hypothetical protein
MLGAAGLLVAVSLGVVVIGSTDATAAAPQERGTPHDRGRVISFPPLTTDADGVFLSDLVDVRDCTPTTAFGRITSPLIAHFWGPGVGLISPDGVSAFESPPRPGIEPLFSTSRGFTKTELSLPQFAASIVAAADAPWMSFGGRLTGVPGLGDPPVPDAVVELHVWCTTPSSNP